MDWIYLIIKFFYWYLKIAGFFVLKWSSEELKFVLSKTALCVQLLWNIFLLALLPKASYYVITTITFPKFSLSRTLSYVNCTITLLALSTKLLVSTLNYKKLLDIINKITKLIQKFKQTDEIVIVDRKFIMRLGVKVFIFELSTLIIYIQYFADITGYDLMSNLIYWSLQIIIVTNFNHTTNLFVAQILIGTHLFRLLNEKTKKEIKIFQALQHSKYDYEHNARICKITCDKIEELSILHAYISKNMHEFVKSFELPIFFSVFETFTITLAEVRQKNYV